MNEKTISQMNMGKRAQFTLESVGPLLDLQRDKLVNDIKNLYRSGSATEGKLLAVASGLCTIDDIESRLKSLIRQGESASKEIIDGKK